MLPSPIHSDFYSLLGYETAGTKDVFQTHKQARVFDVSLNDPVSV